MDQAPVVFDVALERIVAEHLVLFVRLGGAIGDDCRFHADSFVAVDHADRDPDQLIVVFTGKDLHQFADCTRADRQIQRRYRRSAGSERGAGI